MSAETLAKLADLEKRVEKEKGVDYDNGMDVFDLKNWLLELIKIQIQEGTGT